MTYPAAQRRLKVWEELGFPYDDDAQLVKETHKAIRVKSSYYGTLFWVPKSALHHTNELTSLNKQGLLVVRSWFALKARWLMRDGMVNSEHFWPKKPKPKQLELI